jgi:hypothetical protein
MIFLIAYDRPKGSIERLERFDDSERREAEALRLRIEIDLRNRNVEREVVLLDATSEQALRKTHRRYFEDVSQISKSIGKNAA